MTDGSTTITSATANFGTDVVGNVLYIQGGTGSITAGWYHITTRNSATSITVDRSTGLTAGTGATLKIGGALLTINALAPIMVASNKAFIKGTGFTTTATITFSAASVTPGIGTHLCGYGSTRTDRVRAKLTLQTNSGITGLTSANNGWIVENIEVDCNNLATSTGMAFTGTFTRADNCKVTNWKSNGINFALNGEVTNSEATGGTGGIAIQAAHAHANDVYDCVGTTGAISLGADASATGNIIDTVGGYGIASNFGLKAEYNTIYNVGTIGISVVASFIIRQRIKNNVIANCATSGLTMTPTQRASFSIDGNSYYSNGAGGVVNRSGCDDLTGVNAINPYVSFSDVILTSSPFVDAAARDFRLNNTAGGGAGCRANALPGTYSSGGNNLNYRDRGALQHQETSSGGLMVNPGMDGGMQR